MIRRALSTSIVILGVFLVAAAVGLTVWNFKTDADAGKTNEEILNRMVEVINASAIRDDDNSGGLSSDGSTGSFTPGIFTNDYSQESVQGDAIYTYVYTPDGTVQVEKEIDSLIVDGREYIGILSIPSLGLELSVMKECSDKTIDVAPGRYVGSPTRNGFVIGGHNYIRHLGKIDRLKEGDKIIFMDLQGIVFKYKVFGQQILDADMGAELCSDEWAMSLFTCTLAGNKRIVVRCMRDE